MTGFPLQAFMDAACSNKVGFGWRDLQPILHVARTHGHHDVVLLVGGGVSVEAIAHSVQAGSQVNTGPISTLGLLIDLYVPMLADGTVDLSAQTVPGSLQSRWQRHDREGISEAIVCSVVHANDSAETGFMPYDAATKTWGPETITGPMPPFSPILAASLEALR